MADFTVPKGKDYTFTVKVMGYESFLPQDLTTLTSAKIDIIDISTSVKLFTVSTYTIIDAINGMLKFTLPAVNTAAMVSERGEKVDDSYLKPTYQAIITITGSGFTEILSIIDKVYVIPVGA